MSGYALYHVLADVQLNQELFSSSSVPYPHVRIFLILRQQYNNKLDDNVTNVFGAKFLSTLSPVDIYLNEEEETEDGQSQPGDMASSAEQEGPDGAAKMEQASERKIWGMVSKAGEGVGRADNDRQFLYLNGRPVDVPKVM